MRGLNTEAHCEPVQQHWPKISAAQEGVKQEDLELKGGPKSHRKTPSLIPNKYSKDIKMVKEWRNCGLHQDGLANSLHHLQWPLQTCKVRPCLTLATKYKALTEWLH